MPRLHEAATIELQAPAEFDNPLREPEVPLVFTAPSGRERCAQAFWDGGTRWLARTEADEVGRWRWQLAPGAPEGFSPAQGDFEVEINTSNSAVWRHGAVRPGLDGFRLVHADGTPFFWLADTAWNGLLKARPADWRHYLATRRAQGFTAVQCVMTHWRGLEDTGPESRAYLGDSDVRVNPAFYRRIDEMVEAVNREGLLAALVVLWTYGPQDPGNSLPIEDCRAIARYIVARYGAYQVAWFLGGDGRYGGEEAERWRVLGRELFADSDARLATMHPCGESWIVEEFRDEPWYGMATWQSGHGDSEKSVAWLTRGPSVDAWRRGRRLPCIDLEPRYEGIAGYKHKRIWDAHGVRKGLWWNLLMKPTAGVSYGHHGVWPWSDVPAPPPGHPGCNESPTWREGLESDASTCFRPLRKFFDEAIWSELLPAPEMLAEQPGDEDPERTVAAARHRDARLAACYLPHGGEVRLRARAVVGPASARWFDPREGRYAKAPDYDPEIENVYRAPDDLDWALVLEVSRDGAPC